MKAARLNAPFLVVEVRVILLGGGRGRRGEEVESGAVAAAVRLEVLERGDELDVEVVRGGRGCESVRKEGERRARVGREEVNLARSLGPRSRCRRAHRGSQKLPSWTMYARKENGTTKASGSGPPRPPPLEPFFDERFLTRPGARAPLPSASASIPRVPQVSLRAREARRSTTSRGGGDAPCRPRRSAS